MRLEIFPLTAILDDVELVVSAVRESKEVLLTELGDVHVAAHGEIDEHACDRIDGSSHGHVAHVRVTVIARPGAEAEYLLVTLVRPIRNAIFQAVGRTSATQAVFRQEGIGCTGLVRW